MTRIATFAAVAALLALAAPAAAQPSIRIATAGKTPAEVQVAVQKAAWRLCARENVGASFPVESQRACVKAAVRTTMQQLAGAAAPAEVASR